MLAFTEIVSLLLLVCSTVACRQDMHDQPKYEPLQESHFFSDHRSSRPLIEGTVAQGQLKTDKHLHTGKRAGQLLDTLPFPVTEQVLKRGRQRYDIFCSPCHARVGTGEGIVVQRGFRPPPSLHTQRLREAPVGHLFDVITNGYATMYSYATRISPSDRWAIVAYVRALQLSQHARIEELPERDQTRLREIEE
jgi:mono/diheme cytochrome c family protein